MARKKQENSRLLQDVLVYTGTYTNSTEIVTNIYNSKLFTTKQCENVDQLAVELDSEHIYWYQVKGFSNAEQVSLLGKKLGLRFEQTRDIIGSEYQTKMSSSSKHNLFILNGFSYNSQRELVKERIALLLGDGYVATFQEGNNPIFDGISLALKENMSRIREKGEDYLFCLLVDSVIDGYVMVIGELENSLEEMESVLIDTRNHSATSGHQLLSYRKEVQQLKRTIIPLKELLPRFIHSDYRLVKKENENLLIDINDHLQLALQLLDSCREGLSSLADQYFANNDTRMNEIMTRLTVVSTIFIPLTFVVGLWGMNFKNMPELKWEYGYLAAWGSFIAIAILSWWYLKRKKWL